jgi:HK97 gp10 family phage protein
MAEGMKMEMTLRGLDGVLETLKSLPPEVVSKRGGPVKAALRKGANVILKAEKANLRAVMGHQVDGERREATGLVLKNLVATRGKPRFKGERYVVRVKKKKYPRKGKDVHTLKTASLLEHGSSKQSAEPWVRPAFNAKAAEAIRTIERELIAGVDKVVRKLAAQNKGK